MRPAVWGSNLWGQLGDGTTVDRHLPVGIHLLGSITATRLAAGGAHSLAFGRDGWVYAWGNNTTGQLGVGAITPPQLKSAFVMPPSGFTAKDIAAGGGHSLAVGADGLVYAWGDNSKGQADGGALTSPRPYPALIKLPVKDITVGDGHAIAAGGCHSLAIGVDEQVYAWGDNAKGQVSNLRAALAQSTPVPVDLPAIGPIAVAAGEYHSLALGSSGQVYAWGDNASGQLGCGNTNRQRTPVSVQLPAGIRARAIAAGGRHSLALCSDGKIYIWGDNIPTPKSIRMPSNAAITAIAAGQNHSLALDCEGRVYAWGANTWGQLGLGDNNTSPQATPALVSLPTKAIAIAAGTAHSLALSSDGTLYAWGENTCGQLGTGIIASTAHPIPTPVNLFGPIKAMDVAAGGGHSLALGSDSQVYAWGFNGYGQLGQGDRIDRYTPERVSLPPGVKAIAIAAKSVHSLALGSDGQVYAWGDPFPKTPMPIRLAPGVAATAIAAGWTHNLALGSDGKVYAWGENDYGQLGTGRGPTFQKLPVPVPLLLPSGVTIKAIAAGLLDSLALDSAGHLYTWGEDWGEVYWGQWSDVTTVEHHKPVRVSLPSGITAKAIAQGADQSLAIGSDGKIYAWGVNAITPEPVDLPRGVIAKAIAAGTAHNLAICSSRWARGGRRLIYAWGQSNSNGELGDGTVTASNAPVLVNPPSYITATAIAAGEGHSLATGY